MKNRLGGLAFFRKNFKLVLSVDGICICIASRTRQITTFSAWPYLKMRHSLRVSPQGQNQTLAIIEKWPLLFGTVIDNSFIDPR